MRRFLLLSSLILMLALVLFVGVSLLLAEGGLFHPDSPVFGFSFLSSSAVPI